MELVPILSSLRRNKVGATLIALQIALTLAVLCNALFIIEQQTALSRRPTGVADESSVFFIANQWAGKPSDVAARERTDLAALRALPQVADATASIDHPLGGPSMGEGITLHPDKPRSGTGAMVYTGDAHALRTLGLRLIAGRNFRPEDIVTRRGVGNPAARLDGIIVTRAVARALDPGGNVLGRMALVRPDGTTAPIIGVVARLQSTPFAGNNPFSSHSILLPYLWANTHIFYLVRAKPGQLGAAMTAARNELYRISRQRIILGVQSLAEARHESYRGAHAEAILMGVICAILLGVTAFGIIGLTSYWVTLRMRQIGIRRALGATRGSILRYFQTENLVIAGAGSLLGALLGLAANLWILHNEAMARLPPSYLVIGMLIVLALGQLAVLWPALRAAAVPPAIAARSA